MAASSSSSYWPPDLENFKNLDHQHKFEYYAEYLEDRRLWLKTTTTAAQESERPHYVNLVNVAKMHLEMVTDFAYTISKDHHLTALEALMQFKKPVWTGKYVYSISKSRQTKLANIAQNLHLNIKVLNKGQNPPVSPPPTPTSATSLPPSTSSGSSSSTNTKTKTKSNLPSFSGNLPTYEVDSLSASTLSASHVSASALSASTFNFNGIRFTNVTISGLNVPSPTLSDLHVTKLKVTNLSGSEIVYSDFSVSEEQ